ncbi:hypothetical protein MCOR14_003449 [Pyricularia oryzae]|nr:hypothetical protein MCOR17_008114 [Pyricularia oryzae]KAI6505188.1 hypothetical protein MCOR13_004393 [Pyricularia oryzae]KAI6640494.1 hypothetical protein MCOR14_003449 [Pyricularia oryzae]
MPELDWEPALTVEWAAGFESWLLQFIWEICNDDSDDEVREVDKKPISIYLRYLTEPASFVLYLPYTPSTCGGLKETATCSRQSHVPPAHNYFINAPSDHECRVVWFSTRPSVQRHITSVKRGGRLACYVHHHPGAGIFHNLVSGSRRDNKGNCGVRRRVTPLHVFGSSCERFLVRARVTLAHQSTSSPAILDEAQTNKGDMPEKLTPGVSGWMSGLTYSTIQPL